MSRRLVTIPISHYCEKARWALDRLGLAYHEERHLQVFHYPRTYWFSRGRTVPVLVDGDAIVSDSKDILKYLDHYAADHRRLYPRDATTCREVEDLQRLFDAELGVESRRWVYFHMMPHPVAALRASAHGVPLFECLLAPLCYPFMRRYIARHLDVRPQTVAHGLARCWQIVEAVERRLRDGRRYLVGDTLSAADIALACMMSPLVMPPQYGNPMPDIERLPPRMRDDVREFRATPVGRFVLTLFERERHDVRTAMEN